ncbi:hypothetical protein EDB85DRAFT_1988634 [Lactarius pseudohatsudake]|nr:hypothetical protein EDB85DRAFT_1988634 [Lactarius pseudohatsudake]
MSFSFLFFFFLTHFNQAGPSAPVSVTTSPQPQHHHSCSSTLTPPPRHGRDTSQPHRPGYDHHLDPATSTPASSPPTHSPQPRLDPAIPAPFRHGHLHHPSTRHHPHPVTRGRRNFPGHCTHDLDEGETTLPVCQ